MGRSIALTKEETRLAEPTSWADIDHVLFELGRIEIERDEIAEEAARQRATIDHRFAEPIASRTERIAALRAVVISFAAAHSGDILGAGKRLHFGEVTKPKKTKFVHLLVDLGEVVRR